MSRLGTLLRRPGPGDLSCQELVETITDHLEGALPARRERVFVAHLSVCPHCQAYVAQFQMTIAAIGRAPAAAELEPADREALLTAFHGWAA